MSENFAQKAAENVLRTRFERFVNSRAAWKQPLRGVLERVREQEWEAVVFGGVLRDLMLFGGTKAPRDVDVVVNVPQDELATNFRDVILERNRFGGLRLRVRGWIIDIWSLENTWAFQEDLIGQATFDNLVKSTFLNVEAIAAELYTKRGVRRHFYKAGFFEAIQNRLLDISFEDNPFPSLAVVRALISSVKLQFAISPRLAAYISDQCRQRPMKEFLNAQEKHYGSVRLSDHKLQMWFNSVEEQLNSGAARVNLPHETSDQLELAGLLYSR